MNLQGTPGRTTIVPIDPNNQRVDLDATVIAALASIPPAGQHPPPPVPPVAPPASASQIDARANNYGGAEPPWVPASGAVGLGIDLSNSRMWWYFNGQWQ